MSLTTRILAARFGMVSQLCWESRAQNGL